MNRDSPPALAANAAAGVFLMGWTLLTVPWLLLGAVPPVPGAEIAFPLAAGWAAWNSHRLVKP